MTETRSTPHVLVFGAGAVGSLLGGLLAKSGCQVTLLGRQDTGRVIRQHGLRVELPGRRFTVRPRYIERIEELNERPDIILLTTRAFAVPEAIPTLRKSIDDTTNLIAVQNGIGTEECLIHELPGVRLVAASLTASANWIGPGEVESTSRSGGIGLAAVTGGIDPHKPGRLFSASGLPVSIFEDYRSMKWSKLLLNMMGNAIPAILDWSAAEAYGHRATFQIERAAVLEAVRVLRAEGCSLVSLPGFPIPVLPWLFRLPDALASRLLQGQVRGGRGDKPPSLLLDLQAGRKRTEAAWLYGAVVELGERTGVRTPVNGRVLRVMEAVTRNPELREAFRNRPDRLVTNVALGVEAGTGQ